MPITADSLAKQARAACAEAQCELAVGLLEEAIRLQPANFRFHYWLGVCHSAGCRRHKMVNPDFALEYFQRALRLSPPDDVERAAVLEALAFAFFESHRTPRVAAVRTAIECHRQAASIYIRFSDTEDWAREQFNLGNSLCDLSDLAGEDHWDNAIEHYRNALEVRTLEGNPERHAAILENLGTAYRQSSSGDHAANVRRSIDCYRRALRVYRAAAYPARNAALHINLGNAFLSLPVSATNAAERNARRALRHFDHALRTASSEPGSRQYAVNQYNRALAFIRLADFEAAMGCLQEAYRISMERDDAPLAERIRSQLAETHRMVRNVGAAAGRSQGKRERS